MMPTKKLIQVRRNVTLEDPQMILTTDFLDYDGLFDIGYYFNWGQLKDSQNTLDSKKGKLFYPNKDSSLQRQRESEFSRIPDLLGHLEI